jgi:formylglycine-generating enzyme required for sulfatase activity
MKQYPLCALLLSFSLPAISADMVLVPEGEYVRGSDKVDSKNLATEYGNLKPFYSDEHPLYKQPVDAFYIDKYEISNGKYREFIKATGHAPAGNWMRTGYLFSLSMEKLEKAPDEIIRKLAVGVIKLDMDTRKMDKTQLLEAIKEHYAEFSKLPVTFVSWNDAKDYCEWEGKRLPSETEWEKASRGTNGNEYAWGNDWVYDGANTSEADWVYGAAPVGSYPKDKSPYGVYDTVGNVSEWVDSWYDAYPNSDFDSKLFGKTYKVAKGGGWSTSGHYALQLYSRAAHRMNLKPDANYDDVGFRCAKNALPRGLKLADQ